MIADVAGNLLAYSKGTGDLEPALTRPPRYKIIWNTVRVNISINMITASNRVVVLHCWRCDEILNLLNLYCNHNTSDRFWVNVISFTAGFNRVVLFLENAFTEQFIGF